MFLACALTTTAMRQSLKPGILRQSLARPTTGTHNINTTCIDNGFAARICRRPRSSSSAFSEISNPQSNITKAVTPLLRSFTKQAQITYGKQNIRWSSALTVLKARRLYISKLTKPTPSLTYLPPALPATFPTSRSRYSAKDELIQRFEEDLKQGSRVPFTMYWCCVIFPASIVSSVIVQAIPDLRREIRAVKEVCARHVGLEGEELSAEIEREVKRMEEEDMEAEIKKLEGKLRQIREERRSLGARVVDGEVGKAEDEQRSWSVE